MNCQENHSYSEHGVPLRWQSRISVCKPTLRFVDEQTRGPYRRIHHEHIFEAAEGGTLGRAIVDYAVYGGSLIIAFFVRPDASKIFGFPPQQAAKTASRNGRFDTTAH